MGDYIASPRLNGVGVMYPRLPSGRLGFTIMSRLPALVWRQSWGLWRSCKIAVGGGTRVWVDYIAAIAYVARIAAIGGQKRTHGVCVLALGGDM